MKNLKKVLALVVALTMVFTTVAFASYPDVDVEADYAGAVELLSALDILKGDENGNFNPDNTITRAEFAAVVCRALGLENSAASAKGATMFKDVAADHWASGYINLASQQGIINGKGNGMFDPEGNVTYAEAVKMLVVAIGYEPMAATKGGWPTGYLSVANSTKMTAGVGGAADVAALRSTVAMLTANALEIPMMDQTAYGSETKYEPMDDYNNYMSLLKQQDVYKATGVISKVDLVEGEVILDVKELSEDFSFGWNNGVALIPDKAGVYTQLTADIGASNVVEHNLANVDLYVKKEGRNKYVALIAVPSGIGETLTINASDLEVAEYGQLKWEYYETVDSDKTTKIDIVAAPTVLVNGVPVTVAAEENFVTKYDKADAVIKFIANDDDKYFDVVDITIYEHAIVEEVEVAKNRIVFLDGTKVSFDEDNEDQIVSICDVDGNEIALEDIKAGDVLAMVVGDDHTGSPKKAKSFKDKIIIYDLGASSVTGTLNQANESDEVIYIDGVQYEYNTEFVSEKSYEDLFKDGIAKLGTEGVYYLGITGKIIGFEGVEGSTGNYAFILQGDESPSKWDQCYQIKVLLADGTIAVLDIDDEVEIEGVKNPVEFANQGSYFKLPEFSNLVKDPADVAKDTDGDGFIEGDKEGTKDDKGENKVESDVEVGYILNADAPNRVIDYKANSKGVVTYIDFVGKADNKVLDTSKTFNVDTNKVGGATLASDVVIFNVDCKDIDDATVVGLDALVDDGAYEGYAIVKDDNKGEYEVLVMAKGESSFDAEAPLYVVENVVKTTYGEDKEDSLEVTYYVDGSNEMAKAIFVDESENKSDKDFKASDETLKKGALFVANTNAEGLVNDYVIFAKVVDGAYVLNNSAAKDAYSTEDVEDVEIFCKQIKTIKNNKTITFFGETKEEDYTIKAAAAQYCYIKGNKPKLTVGDWYTDDVDEADTDAKTANYAFVKVFDGTVTDIISFAKRVAIAE